MKKFVSVLWISLLIGFGKAGCIVCTEKETIITNPEQHDGFGSQFHAIIASVIYAELQNKRYAYTPFQKMDHNYNNDPEFLAKKEWLINFMNNFDSITTFNQKNYTIVSTVPYKTIFDHDVLRYAQSSSLQKIRRIFRANKNPAQYYTAPHMHIAIHIRRPNPHDNRTLGTNTPDKTFLTIIKRLRNFYAEKNPLFHLYSQGTNDDFAAFNAPDIILHLNESTEDTFCGMVFANALVTSASCFSYAAGLLSEGIVYYLPFWHTPLPSWIPVSQITNLS